MFLGAIEAGFKVEDWEDVAAFIQVVSFPAAIIAVIATYRSISSQIKLSQMEKRVDVSLNLDRMYHEIRTTILSLKSRELKGDSISVVELDDYVMRFWHMQAMQWDFLVLGLMRKEKYLTYLIAIHDRFHGEDSITCLMLDGSRKSLTFSERFLSVGQVSLRNDLQCLELFKALHALEIAIPEGSERAEIKYRSIKKLLDQKLRKFGYFKRIVK